MINQTTGVRTEDRKAQMEIQNKEITETLRHIKNKILVMSGLKCPYCGETILRTG